MYNVLFVLVLKLMLPVFDLQLAPADDFAPGLGLFALFMIILMLLMIGAGMVIAAVGFVLLVAASGLGILTTSALAGFLTKKPSTGFKALFIQLGALVGIPAGAFLAYVGSIISELDFSMLWLLLCGAGVGLIGGMVIAGLFNWVWGKALAFLSRVINRSRQAGGPVHTKAQRD